MAHDHSIELIAVRIGRICRPVSTPRAVISKPAVVVEPSMPRSNVYVTTSEATGPAETAHARPGARKMASAKPTDMAASKAANMAASTVAATAMTATTTARVCTVNTEATAQ